MILDALLCRGRLVPAWLSLWGLLGGVLVVALGAVEVGGVAVPGEVHGLLVAPIGLNEMALAVWLIVRGFDPRGLRDNVQSTATVGRPSLPTPVPEQCRRRVAADRAAAVRLRSRTVRAAP